MLDGLCSVNDRFRNGRTRPRCRAAAGTNPTGMGSITELAEERQAGDGEGDVTGFGADLVVAL